MTHERFLASEERTSTSGKMNSTIDYAADASFGPQYGSRFDFTLKFEAAILALLPATLLVATTPVFLFLTFSKTEIVASGWLLWSKLVAAIALIAAEITNLVLWSTSLGRNSETAVSFATLTLVAALCLAVVLHSEHKHTLASTAFIAVWLVATIFCDGTRARSYFLRPDLHTIGIVTSLSAGIKAVILALEEVPKGPFVKYDCLKKEIGGEATSGFFSRSLFVWVNRTLFYGFKNAIGPAQMDKLGPSFKSKHLSELFSVHWARSEKKSPNALAISCSYALLGSFLNIIFPRLCYAAFTLSQPLLLYQAVMYVESTDKSRDVRNGLIGGAALIYVGISLARSRYVHLSLRLVTRLRGMLVMAIYRKSLRLSYTEAQKAEGVSLITADVDGVIEGLPYIHDIWACFIEFGVCMYLLTRIVGKASIFVLVPTAISNAMAWYIGEHMPTARKKWNKSMQARVSKTTLMLSQLKAIKMIGLDKVTFAIIQGLRRADIQLSVKFRYWSTLRISTNVLCHSLPGPVVIAGGIFWSRHGNNFTPAEAFSALAVIALVGNPLHSLVDAYPEVKSTLGCLQRVQEYLLLPEVDDQRALRATTHTPEPIDIQDEPQHQFVFELQQMPANLRPKEDNRVIEIKNLTISYPDTEDQVIKNATFFVERCDVVAVVGPTACGKSSLIRALLGEMYVVSGSLYVEDSQVAYCGQVAWIKNVSIKDNIIGNSEYDEAWYNTVLDSCLLKPDLERISGGDEAFAGSNGCNLSGGQKHRVAIARALYTRSKFLLIDDALSALDCPTAQEMYARLFGEEGLLHRCLTTVIVVTNSIDLIKHSNRVVLIDEEHNVTTETNIANSAFQQRIEEVSAKAEEVKAKLKQQMVSDDSTATDEIIAKAEEEEEDLVRQHGDVKLYVFYMKSFHVLAFSFWTATSFLASFCELFPDAYMRIWLDLHPRDNRYYIGYAGISCSAFFAAAINVGFWFMKLVPSSSEYLHYILLDTVIKAKLSYLSATDNGFLLNRFNQDMSLISQKLPTDLLLTFYTFCNFLIQLGFIIAATRYTAALIPPLLIAIYFIQLYYLRTSRQMRHLDLEAKAPLNTLFSESAAGLQHIRGFGWEENCIREAYELLDASQQPFYYLFGIQRWLSLVMDMTSLATAMITISVAVCVSYATTGSGVGLSMLGLVNLSGDCSSLVMRWTDLETSLGALARLREFVNNTPLEEDGGESELKGVWPHSGHVVLKDVVAKYSVDANSSRVLNNVSIDIPAGSKVGIIGRTGSGKSSLLMTLLNFLDYSGQIIIDGIDISTLSRHMLRTSIITISQDAVDLDETVRDTICPWSTNLSAEESKRQDLAITKLLQKLRLWSLVEQKGGLGVTTSVLKLSNGQKQLLSVARAVLRAISTGSRLVFMDEAISTLDNDTDELVQGLVKEMFAHCTVISVAHRLETIADADITLEMANGMIVAKTETTTMPSNTTPSELFRELSELLPSATRR